MRTNAELQAEVQALEEELGALRIAYDKAVKRQSALEADIKRHSAALTQLYRTLDLRGL